MEAVFPPVPNPAAALQARLEPLVSLEARFPRVVPVSGAIDPGLPLHGLPLGCVHEVQSRSLACGAAFASVLAARIPPPNAQLVHVAQDASFHPLGLLPYGIAPERWIHVAARNPVDLAWAVLEALRCPRVGAVLAVVKGADLTLCRRWQLAAEASGATGFLLTADTPKPAIASILTRWRIRSIPAPAGATFAEAFWDIELRYCRGGRPASWQAALRGGELQPLAAPAALPAPRPAPRPAQPARPAAAAQVAV